MSRFTDAFEALSKKTTLDIDQRVVALKALHEAGLLDSPVHAADAKTFTETRRAAVLTMVQAAADPRNVEMLRIVRANARRLGIGELFEDGSKPIDMHALNKGLSKAPLADRWRFREMLYSLKLTPA